MQQNLNKFVESIHKFRCKIFRKNTKQRQTNLFGFTNLVSDQMLKEIEESEEQSAEAD